MGSTGSILDIVFSLPSVFGFSNAFGLREASF